MLENNLIGDALPVLKWLADQRNALGGFVSSQDTVVGIQALMAFAERFSSQANNVQISVQFGQGAETTLNVNAQNSLALQSYEVSLQLIMVYIFRTSNFTQNYSRTATKYHKKSYHIGFGAWRGFRTIELHLQYECDERMAAFCVRSDCESKFAFGLFAFIRLC